MGRGGGAEVVQQYLREARREEARQQARRAARQAMRAAVRRAKQAGLVTYVDRVAFACAMLCGHCGWLRWPDDPTAGDPQRRVLPSDEPPMCSQCGGKTWLDLQHVPTFESVQQVERFDAAAVRGKGIGIGVGIASVGLVGIAMLAAVVASPVLAALLGVFAAGGLMSAVRAVGAAPGPRRLPRRWSMVLPPRGALRVVASGNVIAPAKLRAPLSGRECIAYEVAVRHDADADAPLSTWAMVEQRNAALEVAGASVPAGRAHLELPREPYVFAENDASAQKYLQARGIHPHDGDLVVFETIVEADAAVDLAVAADGTLMLTRATNGREPERAHRVSPPA